MNNQERMIVYRNIRRLDPQEKYVKIELERREIRYSDKIKQHRKKREVTNEEIIRAYCVVKLITQWKY